MAIWKFQDTIVVVFCVGGPKKFADSYCLSLMKNRIQELSLLFSEVEISTLSTSIAIAIFELTRRPSRALDSPHALLTQIQTYKDMSGVLH